MHFSMFGARELWTRSSIVEESSLKSIVVDLGMKQAVSDTQCNIQEKDRWQP